MDQAENRRERVLLGVSLILEELLNSSTSSSSESDEDLDIVQRSINKKQKRGHVPKIQNYVEVIVPAFNDQQFKSHFRMSCATFDYILSIIQNKLQRVSIGAPTICPRKQFLLALWRLATPDSLRSICERFGVGRSTALVITRRVTKALITLAPFIIKWPTNERACSIWHGFEVVSGFPKVLGGIDGTHIRIPAPKRNPEAYINRKGYHSIQLQAVCDNKCQFIHCYAGHVGSVHDQRVFRLSEVQNYLGDPLKFIDDCHLLGDAAYKLHNNLLVPFKDNGHLTRRQNNYNFCHGSARIAIERSFGLLKGRFRSLLDTLPIKKCELVPAHIIACCVLHNICLMRNDELEIELNPDEEMREGNSTEQHEQIVGNEKRDRIRQQLALRD